MADTRNLVDALSVASTTDNGVMSSADKVKLNGIAAGATANSADATLLARANHTGTQLAATISDFIAAVEAVVGEPEAPSIALADLTDVGTSAPATNDVLVFDTFWLNKPAADAGLATTAAVTTAIGAHTGDSTAAHAATAISVTPAGSIAATDVQAALEELAAEIATGGSDTHTVATSAPSSPAAGDIWLDTDEQASSDYATLAFVIDGGGATITTGVKGDIEVPFNCVIERVTLLADQSGSIVVQLWRDTYANYPPTSGDAIYASAPPTITTATKSQDATLTGWTTALAAGDIIRYNVASVTTIQRVTCSLHARKT
jgi:hypothetical protein